MADRTGDFLDITAKESGLVLQSKWSGIATSLVPKNELEFFSKHQPVLLKFTEDEKGNMTQMLASDCDPWTKARPLTATRTAA
jgi:hypothetical protein